MSTKCCKSKAAPRKRTYAKAPVKPKGRPGAPRRVYTSNGDSYMSYKGHGDYMKAPKALRASSATQKSLGGTIGAHLGHGLQTVIKALTGFGDYEVESNSLMSPTLKGDPPILQNTTSNSFVVHHREYIGDVFASSAFTTNTYPINPGLVQTFPWAHQIADSFEQYRMRGLVFEYKSMSSDSVLSASASSALGTVIMSTQYNALSTVFTDKRTMENYEYANSCKPSSSMMHPVECKISQTGVSELYVRTGAIGVGDTRLYDLGNFTIAVQGMQNVASSNVVIGELWCTFEVEFYKPKLIIGGGDLLTDHFTYSGPNAISQSSPFGAPNAVITPRGGNNLGCVLQVAASSPYQTNTLVWPKFVVDGLYEITFIVAGSTSTLTPTWNPLTASNINLDIVSTQVAILQGNTVSGYVSPLGGTMAQSFSVTQIVKITQTTPGFGAGLCFNFASGVFPSGTQVVDLFISQISALTN